MATRPRRVPAQRVAAADRIPTTIGYLAAQNETIYIIGT